MKQSATTKAALPEMAIPLNGRFRAIIDADNYDWLSAWTWRVDTLTGTHRYAVCRTNRQRMHRLVIGAKPGQMVDHINGNTLDNRRVNLRICTSKQNCQNRKSQLGRKYKGITLTRERKLYEAIRVQELESCI